MTYAKGLQAVPYPLGSPEWESFKNYVQAYYKEAIEIACNLTTSGAGAIDNRQIYMAILNACLSPLVFLWEKWQIMGLDDKLKYATPEYKKELERIKAEAQKIKEKAGTA